MSYSNRQALAIVDPMRFRNELNSAQQPLATEDKISTTKNKDRRPKTFINAGNHKPKKRRTEGKAGCSSSNSFSQMLFRHAIAEDDVSAIRKMLSQQPDLLYSTKFRGAVSPVAWARSTGQFKVAQEMVNIRNSQMFSVVDEKIRPFREKYSRMAKVIGLTPREAALRSSLPSSSIQPNKMPPSTKHSSIGTSNNAGFLERKSGNQHPRNRPLPAAKKTFYLKSKRKVDKSGLPTIPEKWN